MSSFFTHEMQPQHARLVEARADFLSKSVCVVQKLVPATLQLWCYGINALKPNKPTNDWDFIAFVADDTPQAQIDLLNSIGGPLDQDRRIGNQTLDIQVMRISDRSPCANLIRSEGFCFWQKPITLDSVHHAA